MRNYLHVQMLSEEKLYLYTTKLRSGDASVVEPLILHHIPLAAHFAGKFVGNKDVLSFAFIGIVQGVNRILNKETELKDNNLTPYLIKCIRGSILDGIKHDHNVRIPRSALRKGYALPKIITITISPDKFETNLDYLLQTRDSREEDIQDIFIELKLSPRDIEILQMKIQGYTYSEIAKEKSLSVAMVGKIVNIVREKLIKYLGLRRRVFDESESAET